MTGRISLLLAFLFISSAIASNVGEVAYGDYYKMRSRSALKTYREGLKSAIRLADRKKEVVYLNNIATIFNAAGAPDSCKRYLDEARAAAAGNKALELITGINTALFNHQLMDVSEDQIKGFKDVLTVFELSALYTAAGRLTLPGNPDKALGMFDRAKDALCKETKSVGYANALYYTACACVQKGDMTGAVKSSEQAATVFRKGEYVLGVKKCLKLQLEIFQKTGNKSDEDEARRQLARMP